ncbi:hypothetical protein G3C57_003785 [Salmonella enterica]|uniref:Uncharacterized protein n=2 Tax=Salmonella enterica TaxID=28901 RepID=A0A5V5HA13_SALER|nr:hypothetical protein LFZ28_22230 [Salmonella enterica subsp. enterica serovar Milwaukee str. SA19950795]EAB8341629.1 hypothetical protein [Salmonella enterica subsp. enterica serovar Abaetetuba]EAM6395337.1 hypothetical protein [Salmonella enterica]EBF8311733.1 hypothetical protein [Salmonella enterica subsp. enterica serovar Tamberma]EBS0657093.1 hypothetical protein [Salmonella enterica subsp. enterica serovar Kintambo]EBS6454127.1 hypothetical protein [Salmonella enterica subsp. enterica
MSGSSNTLLCHRPLRTVHASFPAYDSSLYKPALLFGPTTLELASASNASLYDESNNYPMLIEVRAERRFCIHASPRIRGEYAILVLLQLHHSLTLSRRSR